MNVLIRYFALAVIVATPLPALAAPITTGVWSMVGQADGSGVVFWDNASGDDGSVGCPAGGCNAGAVLLDLGYDSLEYLHKAGDQDRAVGFTFDTSVLTWTALFSKTTLWDGTPGQRANGAITYDTNPWGPNNRSFQSLGHANQFALFRNVEQDVIRYFIAFEDIRGAQSDHDYNDLIMTFTERRVAPEPATLVLFGTALAGAALRRRRRHAGGRR